MPLAPPLRSLRRVFAALTLAAAPLAPLHAQITTEGQTFPATDEVARQPLQLNGVGLRAVAWLKGYAAALYLPRKSGVAGEVLGMTGPKRLQIRMLESVDSKEFTKAFQRGVKRNLTEAQLEPLTQRVAAFSATVDALGKLNKGDRIDLDFVPQQGLVLSVNGVVKGPAVSGEDFYAALLKVFIGDKPTDPELKTGLLGGKVS